MSPGRAASSTLPLPSQPPITFHTMQREPEAFAKGRVSHRDHKTLVLRSWHRVVMNAEPAFLD
jgi:hypothetical protein